MECYKKVSSTELDFIFDFVTLLCFIDMRGAWHVEQKSTRVGILTPLTHKQVMAILLSNHVYDCVMAKVRMKVSLQVPHLCVGFRV